METYLWTEHAKIKMRQYGLSEQRVKRIIRHPFREEEGIVPNTVAVMQPASVVLKGREKIWKQEIWAMYKISKSEQKTKITNFPLEQKQLKIITAWRYPGVSPKRNPIPAEVLREIQALL